VCDAKKGKGKEFRWGGKFSNQMRREDRYNAMRKYHDLREQRNTLVSNSERK
jgi:hypothetical protein